MFARPILGVYAVAQVNKAMGWQPVPWLQGVETMTAITPLMSGLSRYGVGQWLVHAPLIGALVQGAHAINQALSKPLKDDYGVPVLVTRLATSAVLMTAGYFAIPPVTRYLLKAPLSKRWFPPPKEASVGATLAGAMTTCARGCTPGGLLCMSELSELVGSLGQWASGQAPKNTLEHSKRTNDTASRPRFGHQDAPQAPTPEEQALMDALEQQMVDLYRPDNVAQSKASCCETQSHGASCCEAPPEAPKPNPSRFETWVKSPNPLKRFAGRILLWGQAFLQSIRSDLKILLNPFSTQKTSFFA